MNDWIIEINNFNINFFYLILNQTLTK